MAEANKKEKVEIKGQRMVVCVEEKETQRRKRSTVWLTPSHAQFTVKEPIFTGQVSED